MLAKRPIMPNKLFGFSLIELVIVMVIVGILGAVLVINWPKNALSLDGQTEHLAKDIRYTQSLAMHVNTRYQLKELSSTSYQILSIGTTPIITVATITLASGITFSSFPNSLIAFNGAGKPYSDTSIPGTPLAATMSITLALGAATKTLTIQPNTGYVNR